MFLYSNFVYDFLEKYLLSEEMEIFHQICKAFYKHKKSPCTLSYTYFKIVNENTYIWCLQNGLNNPNDHQIYKILRYVSCNQNFMIAKSIITQLCVKIGEKPQNLIYNATFSNNEKLVFWLANQGWKISSKLCEIASRHGHLKMLKSFINKNIPCDGYSTLEATKNGHLHTLKYLKKHNPNLINRYRLYSTAAHHGHLNILKWISNTYPEKDWIPIVCSDATKQSHLHILKWLHSQNLFYNWDELSCEIASEKGDLKILKWLIDNNYEVDMLNISYEAKLNGYVHILEWLQTLGYVINYDEYTCMLAIDFGHFHLLKWLKAQNPPCPWNKQDCIEKASQKSQEIVAWIMEQP